MRTCLLVTTVLFLGGIAIVDPSFAQAFVPEPGEISFSMAYTRFEGGDHLYDEDVSYTTRGYVCEGRSCFLGYEQSNTFTGSVDVGLLDRVAFSGSINYVGARYDGKAPNDVNVDDGLWRSSFQDAYLQLRVQALRRYPLVLTPFVGFQFPVSDYPSRGHAARGRDVQAWSLGFSLARTLPGLRRGYFQFRYALGSDDLPIDLYTNHFDLNVGYLISRKLSVGISSAFRLSSGGLSWSGGGCGHACPPDVQNALSQEQELGVAASNSQSILLGAGVNYQLAGIYLFASAATTVFGANTVDADFYSAGVGYSFRIRQER